jgi:hypothetical protein
MTYVGSIAIEAGDQVRFARTAPWNQDRVYTVDEVTATEVVIRTPMSSGPMSEPYRLTHEEFGSHGGERVPDREAEGCPDGGTCHHGCTTGCFRVSWAGPLSGVYPGDEWPADVRAAEASSDGVL